MVANGTSTWTLLVVLVLFWYFGDATQSAALEWGQHAKLTADDAAFGDHLGWSVSIDGVTALVGAPRDDDNDGESGSAYVFEQTEAGWTQVAKLLPEDGADDDRFGWNLSISGDTAIVGVNPDEDVFGNQGWAYIFQQEDTGWTQVAKIRPRYGYFGRSLAIDGSIAIVGAPESRDDDLPDGPGNAYIFEESDSGWPNVARLQPDDSGWGDRFGKSVSVHVTA